MIPVFTHPEVLSWPLHLRPRQEDIAAYLSLGEMLTTHFKSDVHFSQYSHPEIERRLSSKSLGHDEIPGGIRMALLVLDIDDEVAHKSKTEASPAFREESRRKVEELFRKHPGGYYYESRGGYRLIYRNEFVIESQEVKTQWKDFYFRVVCYLYQNFGIASDPACSDWTRLFRVPHATRDGSAEPEDRPAMGDPNNVGDWPKIDLPTEEECVQLADTINPTRDKGHGWWKVQLHFLPHPVNKNQLRLVDAPANNATMETNPEAPRTTNSLGAERSKNATMGTVIKIDRSYALSSLHREFKDLSTNITGSRTNALRSSALRLYSLVKADALGKEEVDTKLWQACVANGWTHEYSTHDFHRQLGRFWEMAEKRDLSHVGRSTPEISPGAEGGEVKLSRGPKGALLSGIANVKAIAEQDPAFAKLWALDTFTSRMILQRDVDSSRAGDQVDRDNITSFRAYCTEVHGVIANKDDAREAIYTVAKRDRYSSALRWLDSLPPWDKVPRLDTWLCSYLKAEDSEYTRLVGPWWIIQAVARIEDPGEQCDGTLVLEGFVQGEGKSSLAFALVPVQTWACDQPLDILKAKDTAEIIQGKLIVELAEMSSLKRADIETVKAFLTQRSDNYRAPWGEVATDHPRQCIFLGTTNNERYLRDPTGNRRFWPVKVEELDRDALRKDRDQLWAEARWRFLGGEKWWPQTEGQKELLRGVTSLRQVREEALGELIEAWLRKEETTEVSLLEVLVGALQLPPSRVDKITEQRVSQCLKDMGWVRGDNPVMYQGKRTRTYKPPSDWSGTEGGLC